MELSKTYQHLVLSFDLRSGHNKVKLYSPLYKALSDWGPCTRISPIIGVKEFGTDDPGVRFFPGNHYLFFLGPLQPAIIEETFEPTYRVWLTMGLFNIIINVPSEEGKLKLLEWVESKDVRYEYWKLVDDVVIETIYSTPKELDHSFLKTITKISKFKLSSEVNQLTKEYCTLMTSTISRAGQSLQELLQDLYLSNELVLAILIKASNNQAIEYEVQSMITKINAGLSRLSSQTFSGSTPIQRTECHYWTHSLLGTGVANLALYRLFSFIRDKLGVFRIDQKLKQINPKPQIIDLCKITYSEDFWYKDYLKDIVLTIEELDKPIFPLFTYFSGRDGFKSTETTLSAPLAAVSSCNCRRWTLMTLTHEISHIFIKGCLGEIFTDRNSDSELEKALCFLKKAPPNSWIEEISRYLLLTIAEMEKNNNGLKKINTINDLRIILDNWYHEVNEIMTHVFDFLYFYRGNLDNYVRSIWLSWSVIPNIRNRINEYVLRTLCATLVLHLRKGAEAEEIAKDQLLECFERIKVDEPNLPYIDAALDYLKNKWQKSIRGQLLSRKALVAIVRTFFLSETARASLLEEYQLTSHKAHTEGYDKQIGRLDTKLIDNPLRFLDIYTTDRDASPSNAFWILSTIAFNTGRPR